MPPPTTPWPPPAKTRPLGPDLRRRLLPRPPRGLRRQEQPAHAVRPPPSPPPLSTQAGSRALCRRLTAKPGLRTRVGSASPALGASAPASRGKPAPPMAVLHLNGRPFIILRGTASSNRGQAW
ncbi:hypothetical protein NL676_024237 [Syzygium grande]|nr:hypothetical protein NL676_024237 [Syzygium grande]